MAAIDQNQTEEKALKYASFCEHDDQMIEAVVERLRGAGSTAAITSDKYSLSDHYIREIVSNVFLDPRLGNIRRGPLDRESVVERINQNLNDNQNFNKSAPNKGLRELWIYNANASGDLASISLAAGLINQFKASGVSILVACSNIVVRTPDFSKWTKKARLNLWRFDLPDTDMKSVFLANARIRGSIHTARELISELNDPKSEKDLDYYFPAPETPKIIPIEDASRHDKKKISRPSQKKKPSLPKKHPEHKLPLITGMIGCMVLSLSLTGALFWKELSENQSVLNLIGSLSVLKVSDNITNDSSSSELSGNATEALPATKTSSEEKGSTENLTQDSTVLKKDPVFSKQEYVSKVEAQSSVTLSTPEPSSEVSNKEIKQVKRETSEKVENETAGLNNRKPITKNLERKITLPIVGGDYYLQAGAFSRRASADRWIRGQNGNEKFRVAKKINGFWVVLLGPFSELDARRQQDLKATENKKYLILKGGELDPLWIF